MAVVVDVEVDGVGVVEVEEVVVVDVDVEEGEVGEVDVMDRGVTETVKRLKVPVCPLPSVPHSSSSPGLSAQKFTAPFI